MIRKQLDSVTLNSYTGSNNELIVPSKVMTSYAKSDASDLSYTNFMISTEMNTSYVGDIYVGGRFPVTFEGDESASCYMNVVSWCNTRNGVKLTLMYSDGLTVNDSSDDSSDDGSSDDPDEPYFSSPTDGDTLTGTLDYETGEFRWPIEVVGSDGNIVSNDNTSMCVTCDSYDWSVGYTEDYDEATGSTVILEVYIACGQAGNGTATLTYDDGEQTCTTTFTYDITEGAHA